MKAKLKIIVLALCSLVIGCDFNDVPTVAFILSNRLEARVDIRLDEDGGDEIPFRNGRYEVVVPRNGQLSFSSLEPLLAPHEQIIRYEGGSPVPAVGVGKLNPVERYWWAFGETVIDGKTIRLIYAVATPAQISKIDTFAALGSKTIRKQ